jgi:hypothetical protein
MLFTLHNYYALNHQIRPTKLLRNLYIAFQIFDKLGQFKSQLLTCMTCMVKGHEGIFINCKRFFI